MKNVMVIGATSAIAQEVAKIYAVQKAKLFLVGRNEKMLEIIAQDLKVRGASEVSVAAQDLLAFDSHEKLIELSWQSFNGFDIVLLAHGVLGNQQDSEKTSRAMLNIVNANFLSHASLLTFIASRMEKQGSGAIGVISSVAGDRGRKSNYVYGSAMAAKSAFVAGLRNRLSKSNVSVITFKLGFVDTPMTKEFKKGPLWAKPSIIAKGIVASIEKKRDVVYLPFFWFLIMIIIRAIPEKIFKKMNL